MEASPKVSTVGDYLSDHGDSPVETPELYTHYLDRIASKEGYRVGMYWTSGDHYRGKWHENLRHGRGMHNYRNGNRYEGMWKNGKRDGHGTFWIKSADGDSYRRKYRGSWKENQYGGKGIIYGLGGELYTGDCERGKRHGLGEQTYRDWNSQGEVYHKYYGRWMEGEREGLGQLTMSNGNIYQGEFKNDFKEGAGVFYFKDKQSKYEGLWRDDIAVSGAYSRNATAPLCWIVPLQRDMPIPFVMFPSCQEMINKCQNMAVSRALPQRYDRNTRRTDAEVCTRKFPRVLYGSPLLD